MTPSVPFLYTKLVRSLPAGIPVGYRRWSPPLLVHSPFAKNQRQRDRSILELSQTVGSLFSMVSTSAHHPNREKDLTLDLSLPDSVPEDPELVLTSLLVYSLVSPSLLGPVTRFQMLSLLPRQLFSFYVSVSCCGLNWSRILSTALSTAA